MRLASGKRILSLQLWCPSVPHEFTQCSNCCACTPQDTVSHHCERRELVGIVCAHARTQPAPEALNTDTFLTCSAMWCCVRLICRVGRLWICLIGVFCPIRRIGVIYYIHRTQPEPSVIHRLPMYS